MSIQINMHSFCFITAVGSDQGNNVKQMPELLIIT